MHISQIYPAQFVHRANNLNKPAHASNVSKISLRNYDADLSPVLISFSGSGKNMKQIYSVSVEDNIFGLGIYKAGGQGSIAEQITNAFGLDGYDARGVVPYVSPGNEKSGIKVLCVPKEMDPNKLPKTMPEKYFKAYPLDTPLDVIAKENNTTADRVLYVIHDPADYTKINGKLSAEKESAFRVIKRMGIKGSIERIDENNLKSLRKIPYELFKWESVKTLKRYINGKLQEKEIPVVRYLIHTPDLAKAPRIYAYDMQSKDNPLTSLFFRDFCDMSVDALPQFASKDKFNPANILAHCRTGFSVTEAVIDRTQDDNFYKGYRVVNIYHNPTPHYQGIIDSPFDMLRYKARPQDWNALKSMPQFERLAEIDAKFRHGTRPTDEEWAVIDKIIRPFLRNYEDDLHRYNLSITPIKAKMLNPFNIDANHVSHTFANAVIEYDDLAAGLTGKFREAKDKGLEIKGRPNGCNIDGWGLDDPKKPFGNAANGLSSDLSWYSPYNPKTDDIEKIVSNKRKNTENFLNLVGDCSEERASRLTAHNTRGLKDKLNKLFYSEADIDSGSHVIGGFTKYDKKDILLMSWGRPDEQKGYPILYEAYYNMLKDPNVPEDYKLHTKLMAGGGPGQWQEGQPHFERLKHFMYKIETEFGGKYKGNVMYVNGPIPNRLTTACTYTIFSSLYEPQGQTPLEGMLAGAPPGSTNEGAAGEAVVTAAENRAKANGFRTKHAYMRNVADLGFEGKDFSKITEEQKTAQRMSLTADEIKDIFVDMNKVYRDDLELYKSIINNGVKAEMDWHNNNAINDGRSTLQLYKEDGFQTKKGWQGRYKKPLNRLVKKFGSYQEKVRKELTNVLGNKVSKTQNRWLKAFAFAGAGMVAAGAVVYLYGKKKSSKLGNSLPVPPDYSKNIPAKDMFSVIKNGNASSNLLDKYKTAG